MEDARIASFPHLAWVAKEYGVRESSLVEVFELEQSFHRKILSTDSVEERKAQYSALYQEVHRIKQTGRVAEPQEGNAKKYSNLVLTFLLELKGKSVIDIGCGNGLFLSVLSKLIPHGHLCGLDTDVAHAMNCPPEIEFIQRDVIDFELDRTFDTAYSHQVLEHIAPADVPSHLVSIHRALNPGGKFVVLLPNKNWGPADITRIVDNTFSGRVEALGSHLNESTYTELIPQLEAAGFHHIRTVLPFAQFVPALRGIRVTPWINLAVERHSTLRKLASKIRLHQRPVFKNPVILICEKRSSTRHKP